jgi:hypothetical protein
MDGIVTRGSSSSCVVGLGSVESGSANGSGSCARAAWARSPQLPPIVSTVTSLKGGSDWTGSELCIAGAGAGSGGEKSSAEKEARALCRLRLNTNPKSRRMRMTAAETDGTMAVTGTDLQKKKKVRVSTLLRR